MFNVFTNAITILLLIPFVGWGIYILRIQLKYREDLRRNAQIATVIGVLIFLTIEISIMQVSLGARSGMYILSVLALLMSTAALYGHLFVSIASQLIVNVIYPNDEIVVERPDFAAAEALEEIGDHAGALNEYLVMGRLFPKDPETVIKIGEAHLELDHIDDAAMYFERAFTQVGDAESGIRITNRLVSIYKGIQEDPDHAKEVLHRYLEKYPESKFDDSVQRRLRQLEPKKKIPFKSVTDLLEPPPSDLLG
jgi:hypothetical protein